MLIHIILPSFVSNWSYMSYLETSPRVFSTSLILGYSSISYLILMLFYMSEALMLGLT